MSQNREKFPVRGAFCTSHQVIATKLLNKFAIGINAPFLRWASYQHPGCWDTGTHEEWFSANRREPNVRFRPIAEIQVEGARSLRPKPTLNAPELKIAASPLFSCSMNERYRSPLKLLL